MADLTVTITESVVLNNADQGGTHTLTVTGVDDVYKRIVTCTNDVDTTLAVFRADDHTADSAIDIENVKYIRVTNLDSADPINISLQIDTGTDGADHQTTILLNEGKSFDISSSVKPQLPFFCCPNIIVSRKLQTDIERYIYCEKFGLQPYPGSYGQQPNRWVQKSFIIRKTLAKFQKDQVNDGDK